MRILQVTNYQPPHMGGIEFAADALKHCWERAGHTATWLTTDIPRGARAGTPDNIRVPAWNFAEDLWQMNTPIVRPLGIAPVFRAVRDHEAVVVHSLAPGLSNVALYAALHYRKPTVVTQHVGVIPFSTGALNAMQEQYICRAARWVLRRDATLTFVGKAVRDWFVAHAKLPAERLVMTPAGIDPTVYRYVDEDERAGLRKKWRVPADKFSVLFVGRFYEKKGMPLLRAIAAQCPEIHFTFRGSGPMDPSAWGLPNTRVVDLVTEKELRELYGAHDLFIMLSVGEGWPAVIPQAMACGLACMISPETFEGYKQDVDQFIVCDRTPDAAVPMIRRAARGDIALVRQRKRVSDYATANWNWETTARIYVDLLRRRPGHQA